MSPVFLRLRKARRPGAWQLIEATKGEQVNTSFSPDKTLGGETLDQLGHIQLFSSGIFQKYHGHKLIYFPFFTSSSLGLLQVSTVCGPNWIYPWQLIIWMVKYSVEKVHVLADIIHFRVLKTRPNKHLDTPRSPCKPFYFCTQRTFVILFYFCHSF